MRLVSQHSKRRVNKMALIQIADLLEHKAIAKLIYAPLSG